MSETKWTPGPWMRDGISVTTYAPAGQPRKSICTPYPDTSISVSVSYARMVGNADLIAAAPDLYEALAECLREHGGYTIKGGAERGARSALAKARGETA